MQEISKVFSFQEGKCNGTTKLGIASFSALHLPPSFLLYLQYGKEGGREPGIFSQVSGTWTQRIAERVQLLMGAVGLRISGRKYSPHLSS